MRGTQPAGTRKDRSRRILGTAIALLATACLLLAASLALDSSATLQPVADALLLAVPYVLLLGFGLLVLYGVRRPPPDRSSRPTPESALFGHESTSFASMMDRDGDDAAAGEPPPKE